MFPGTASEEVEGGKDEYLNTIEDLCNMIQENDSAPLDWLKKIDQSIQDVDYFSTIDFTDEKEIQGANFPLLPRLLHLMRECLLNHRWKEALEVLQSMTPISVGTSRTIWKVGSDLFAQDGAENSDLMLQLYNQIKLVSELNSKEVLMDFVGYYLKTGEQLEAVQKMQAKVRQPYLKRTKGDVNDYIDKLHKAYMGLLWYLEWKKSCNALEDLKNQQQEEECDTGKINPLTAKIQALNMQISNFKTKALSSFRGIKDCPGVWDIFVRRHVELLLYDNNTNDAFTVLKDYCTNNSENLNAHKYMYDFCKEHAPDRVDLKVQLKRISELSPSDELVIELCNELMEDDVYSAFQYLIKLLDYSCWQDQVKPWTMFATLLHKVTWDRDESHENEIEEVDKCIKDRKSWWPSYHFTKYRAQMGKEIPALNVHKTCVASALYGIDCEFVVEAKVHLNKSEVKLIKKYLKEDT